MIVNRYKYLAKRIFGFRDGSKCSFYEDYKTVGITLIIGSGKSGGKQ